MDNIKTWSGLETGMLLRAADDRSQLWPTLGLTMAEVKARQVQVYLDPEIVSAALSGVTLNIALLKKPHDWL